MTKNLLCTFVLLLIGFVASAQQKTTITEVKGTVINSKTKEPIAQCNIYIKGSYLGTVTNNSGDFVLKVPETTKKGIIVASRIGFDTYEISIDDVLSSQLNIKLIESSLMLSEVVIHDVGGILIGALNNVDKNYPMEKQYMTSFYREVIKKNRKYVDVSQGVINISKGSYERRSRDELNVVKGSRSKNYKRDDTLAFKVMGGPNVMLLLDIVKNPGLVLGRDLLDFYAYTLNGVKKIDGRRSYVIEFSPRGPYDSPLYSGTIYIDEHSLAITGLKFGYDDHNLKLATSNLIKRRPSFVTVRPLNISYEVKYRETNGLWYLDYVRNEIEMKCNWKRKLFNSTFSAVSELVVTEKSNDETERVRDKSVIRENDLFSDKISGFIDQNFWEDYSIIQPEEDLQKALVRIDQKKQK